MSESKPSRTVLIVDDEQSLRDALEMTFSREGYQVLKASDGPEALEAARASVPDVVLLDVMMPGMDGYEVCKRLRSHYRTRHIPVILLTAKGTEEDKLEGLQGGANDYVLKPWNKRELVTRVHNHLEWAKTQKAVNPLTGLPGGVSVLAERQRRADQGKNFSQMVLDIDYFKAYNDRYGFTRGDVAISKVAEILTRVVDEDAHEDNFVGHIGGDDFVVLCAPERGEALAERIKETLERELPKLYDEDDRKQGFVRVRNRRHEFENFPLMGVTIALASNTDVEGMHLAQLDDALTELKTLGKGTQGSVVVSERRRRNASSSQQAAA
ncbi:MAG TPA: response regulator [Candidatus Eisenbacteria bacterium]|nr:response regulator [Candidatus Eisenbacteria bacterium]